MLAILLKTLPFFAVIATGFLAGRARFITPEATGQLTRFVFYFALSAMLFGFAANLSLAEIFSLPFVLAYLTGTALVWGLVLALGLIRGTGREAALFEAHTGVIGNVGFLGIPMLVLLLGPKAVGPVLLVLAVDLIVFSSALTLGITLLRSGRVGPDTLRLLALGLLKNPMIVSTVLGMAWGATGRSLWTAGGRVHDPAGRRRHALARCSPSAPRWPGGGPTGR
jgi:malonate transporter